MSEIQNPHDQFVRFVLSQPDLAKSFLENYLSPETVDTLDLATLTRSQESFVDEELNPHHSDLLFRVRSKTNEAVLIYVLLEHKSAPDKQVAFQLLRYIVRIWEKAAADGAKKMPLVIPLVLYHGKTAWKISRELKSLVENGENEAAKHFIPNFRYEICDLSHRSETEIKGLALLRVALNTLRYIFSDELGEKLADIFRLIKTAETQGAVEFLGTVLRYLSVAGRKITDENVTKALKEAFPQEEGEIMITFVQKWLDEGERRGLQQGLQQGEAKIVCRFLERKFGSLSDSLKNQIFGLSLEKVDKLGEEMFDFQTLDDAQNWLNQHDEIVS